MRDCLCRGQINAAIATANPDFSKPVPKQRFSLHAPQALEEWEGVRDAGECR